MNAAIVFACTVLVSTLHSTITVVIVVANNKGVDTIVILCCSDTPSIQIQYTLSEEKVFLAN